MTKMLGAEPNVVNEESTVEMFTGGKESCFVPLQHGHCQAVSWTAGFQRACVVHVA